MKKVISLILALTLLLCLTACGSSDSAAESTPAAAQPSNDASDTPADVGEEAVENAVAEEGFVFTGSGVEIAMNAPAADIIAALGEPKSYTERTSCAFEGLDKTYYFGSFYLETYPVGEEDFVHCVWLVDDSVTTEEGIYIGSSQQEVEEAYGAENFDGANSYVITKGDSTLTVILTNGVVSSIQYDAIVE